MASADGAAPRAWMTTGDQTSLLAEQPPQALTAPDPSAPTIAVDPSQTYQRIEGLGASITDSSAHLLARSPDRDALMRALFDPRAGLGLSLPRNHDADGHEHLVKEGSKVLAEVAPREKF